jgi:S-DNA-T family DNA segregation ATPase FtsK/SpoIIIE
VLGRTTHQLLYHVTRTPKYAAKVLMWAPVGAWKTVSRAVWWARAEEGNWSLRQHAASKNDAKTWTELERIRQRSTAWRWWVFAASALVVLAAAIAVRLLTGPLTQLVAAVATLIGLAVLGRPADKPITDRVVYTRRRSTS